MTMFRRPGTTNGLVRPVAVALSLALAIPGCFRGGGRMFGEMAWMAIITAAIVSSQPPPREVIVYPPAPRSGYSWQPGYWTLVDDDWVWVEGSWIHNYPGYRWSPTHWVEDRGGRWRLVPGEWVAIGPPAAPPPPDR